MTIVPWQAPLFVMGGIIVVESALTLLARRFALPRPPRWVWSTGLTLVFVLAAGLTIIAVLGSSRADQLASVCTGVAALLTFLSLRRPPAPPTDQQ